MQWAPKMGKSPWRKFLDFGPQMWENQKKKIIFDFGVDVLRALVWQSAAVVVGIFGGVPP